MATIKKYGPRFLFIMRFISEKKPVSTVKNHREYDTYSYAENAMTKDYDSLLFVLFFSSLSKFMSNDFLDGYMETGTLSYIPLQFFSCYNFL